MKKKISVLVPTYNEEKNILPLTEAIIKEFENNLQNYDYSITFIDNCSLDTTRDKIRVLCSGNKRIKAIFNASNFGLFNSSYYGMCQTDADATILIYADFQDPIDLIPEFIENWEKGYKIVCGIKTTSKENKLMYFLRSTYYRTIKKMSDTEQIEHFTGFGLYDKSFIYVLRNLNDPQPFLRGIVAELGFKRKDIPYRQNQRRAGKSSYNWYKLYDAAMLGFTSYTKIGLRVATIIGFIMAGLSMLIALVYLVLKLCFWDSFPMGTAPILIGIFLFGSVQLFFIGLLGEYILSINTRIMKRPLVIEDERVGFDDEVKP